MPLVNDDKDQLLDYITNSVTGAVTHFDKRMAATTNWYIGLSSTTPTATGSNFTEPTGGGYARISVANTDWDGAASGGSISNDTVLNFGSSTGAYTPTGPFTHFGFFTASSGGTPFMWAALTTSRSVTASGVDLTFAVGALTLTA